MAYKTSLANFVMFKHRDHVASR